MEETFTPNVFLENILDLKQGKSMKETLCENSIPLIKESLISGIK